jgi:hypothetical protein
MAAPVSLVNNRVNTRVSIDIGLSQHETSLIADAYFTRVLFTSMRSSRRSNRVRGADGDADCRGNNGAGPQAWLTDTIAS